MNEFEKRISALRRQYSAERKQITKDAYLLIGHINNSIPECTFPEAREALRAERKRLYEAMRTSHRYNRLCYRQQLELIEDEYRQYREKHPSVRKLRRMMAMLCNAAEEKGQSSLRIYFGENKSGTVTFD